MKAREFIPATKPRNFVAKNQKTAGAGAHKDKKRAEKQGDLKHKNKQFEQSVTERASQLLSAEDRNGVITVVVQAPDGTKRSLANDNPRYINQWLGAKYGLTLPKSIMSKFIEQSMAETDIQELSTDLLGRYKKAASDDATAADKAGDYDKGHKRFKGIVKATNKQFDNDAKERK